MTRWTIDFAALRGSLRWLPDDQLCGARTRAGYPCRCVPDYRPPSLLGGARRAVHGAEGRRGSGGHRGEQSEAGQAHG